MNKNIAVILLAILAISSFAFVSLANSDALVQSLWIRMRGVIIQWDDTPVFGFIDAHARMVNVNGTYREWARVHAIWSEDRPRLNCTKPPTENFTLVHYDARLINTTDVELNYQGYDLYISGLWNVNRITTAVNIDENGTLLDISRLIEPIVTESPGELRVFPFAGMHWQFELDITGIPLLKGKVIGVLIKYTEIKICDINDDGKVDLKDLVRVARRYRMVPGMFNYNLDIDFNFDNKIDIGDLTTVAANLGK